MADDYRNALMPDQQMVGGEPQQPWLNALMQQAWGARPWRDIDVTNPNYGQMANGLMTAASFMGPGVRMPQRMMATEGKSGGAMSLEEMMAQRPQRATGIDDDVRRMVAETEARGQPAMTPEMQARRAAMQAEADRLRGLAQQQMTPGPSAEPMSFEEMMAAAASRRGR